VLDLSALRNIVSENNLILKEDSRAIFSIASYASHAADWLRERVHAVTVDTPECEKPKTLATSMMDEIAY
jgi:antirestriction protein ArdC